MSPRWEPDPHVRRGRSVVHNLHVHLVFVTKYRRDVFNAQMLTRCEQVMREVCGDFGARMRGHFWSPSYFAGSCGGPPLAIVKDYIAQQKRPDQQGLPPAPKGPGFRPRSTMSPRAGPIHPVQRASLSNHAQ